VLNAEKGAIMVDKQVNVSGTGNIVNVADYMSNVSNTVTNNLAESGATDEIKKLIEELNSEIQKVSAKADPSQVKQMGKNLKALSEEVASDEPERRWYEVSLEGIKEAAEAVGEIAKPVINITKKIAALLLV
jgi:actin-related protein